MEDMRYVETEQGWAKVSSQSHLEDQKPRCNTAPAYHRGDFTAAAEQAVTHTTLRGESKLFLVCQEWGQGTGGMKGKMVIRKRNSIAFEMQDVEETSTDFTHKATESWGERKCHAGVRQWQQSHTRVSERKK